MQARETYNNMTGGLFTGEPLEFVGSKSDKVANGLQEF